MELIKNFINGKFRTYTEVRSPQGYCFYDVDEEVRNYIEYIATPIVDEKELERKFVLVEGNAEELNEELERQRNENN